MANVNFVTFITLHEIDELFDDNDQEITYIVEMQRTHTVKEKIDYFNILDDEEVLVLEKYNIIRL